MSKAHLKKHEFKPGKSGNPSGRPKLPKDIVEARNMNRIELERLINKFINMPREELAAYAQKQGATAIEMMIASIVSKAILKGDNKRLDFLLNRLVGKVPENHNHTGLSVPQVLVTIPDNGRKDNS